MSEIEIGPDELSALKLLVARADSNLQIMQDVDGEWMPMTALHGFLMAAFEGAIPPWSKTHAHNVRRNLINQELIKSLTPEGKPATFREHFVTDKAIAIISSERLLPAVDENIVLADEKASVVDDTPRAEAEPTLREMAQQLLAFAKQLIDDIDGLGDIEGQLADTQGKLTEANEELARVRAELADVTRDRDRLQRAFDEGNDPSLAKAIGAFLGKYKKGEPKHTNLA